MTLSVQTYPTPSMAYGYRLIDAATGKVVAQKAGYATEDEARTAGWLDVTYTEPEGGWPEVGEDAR